MASNETDTQIEQWKVKNLIKSLTKARGNGTSMISLIIPPKDQIARVNKMLSDELGTATNIKSRVNRLSVLSAITSTREKLRLFNKVPPNGLVLYCGTIITDEGKEKKVSYAFEPFKPINTSMYLCDNKFHTEALHALLEDDTTFGFIVMDGNGCLFGTLSGNAREVIHTFTVELPKKHGRGGQSAMRFARLRLEKRHHYVKKVAELATKLFITNDMPNVVGLVLAGSAAFKQVLSEFDSFDGRLKAIIVKIVDVAYGGENGFSQAIELSADALANVKFVHEKQLLSQYMNEIALDTGKFCFGVKDTLAAGEQGAIETLIVWENYEMLRVTVRHPSTGETSILHLMEDQLQDKAQFVDKETGVQLEIVDKEEFLEWLANNYKSMGCTLDFVTDRSQEGCQFVKGFGGIGGILRWPVEFDLIEDSDFDEEDFF